MKKFFYMATLLGTALVFAGCSDSSEFRSDTLENIQTLPDAFRNRGASACTTIEEIEAENRLSTLEFPKVNLSKKHERLVDLSKRLADSFVGLSAERSKTSSGYSFRKDNKIIKVDETKYEISFVNEESYPSESDKQKITPEEVISKVKDFINTYEELGSTNNYYVSSYTGGIYSGTGHVGLDGRSVVDSIRQEAAAIKVNRVVAKIPVLGGIGSIRFSLRSDDTVDGFKIKFLELSASNDNYSGADLIGYKEAEQKARKVLDDQQKDGDSFLFMCEFGYIPDRDDPSSKALVPGYLLRALSRTDGSKALVVVPAVRSVKPIFKSDPFDLAYTETLSD